MGHLQPVFSFWTLLVILQGDIALAVADSVCPNGCLCENHVLACENIDNSSTWMDFVKNLPPDTKSLTITDLVLQYISLPDNIFIQAFPNMTYLRITHCNISVIGSKPFRLFPGLVELHLDSVVAQELNAEALHYLSSLKLLNLTQNVITRLHENTFQDTPHLQVLDLAYNRIDFLYENVFENTKQLIVLNLTANNISYIPSGIFSNLQQLHIVDLSHNQLEVLHPDTFTNLSSLQQVLVQGNHWACDCGMAWLHPENNRTHPLLEILKTGIQCYSPPEHNSSYLDNISLSDLACTKPDIVNELVDTVFLRLDTVILRCNARGFPQPSVYWITPRGVLAVPHNQLWMNLKAGRFQKSHKHISVPNYHSSSLVALEDGSLVIHKISPFLTGNYTCVAESPAGVSFSSFHVAIRTTFQANMRASMAVGGITSLSFLLISMIYVGIRTCVYRWLKKRYIEKYKDEEEPTSPLNGSPSSDCSNRSYQFWLPEYISPYESPVKCTTPIDYDPESCQQQRVNIRETLEDVRFRLRTGMERSVTKIRSGAHQVTESSRQYIHSMRESSNHYMQNIRESGSHTISNLRSTGSQAANKMRAGVVLSVEQVKYHVQSMRELCLNGSLGQTISTISVATDVDSQKKTDIVKKITFV